MSLFNFKKNIDHFKEHCPTEARNYFKEILSKLETIEKRLDDLEKKIRYKYEYIFKTFAFYCCNYFISIWSFRGK